MLLVSFILYYVLNLSLSRQFCVYWNIILSETNSLVSAFLFLYIGMYKNIDYVLRSFEILHFNARLCIILWVVVFVREHTCIRYNIIIGGIFHRETRGENGNREKWRKDSPRKRPGWAARMDRRGCRDRTQSLTAIRTLRYLPGHS